MTAPVFRGYPWRCRIFGHRWVTFDRNWCGTDYQICQRMGFFPLKICGAVRNIRTAIADRSAIAPRRETGVARKGESGGAGSAIAHTQSGTP